MEGIPLLSGRPPDRSDLNENNCRRCNKEFKFFITRSKKCNHCGYLFCSSCTDYQALLPRSGPETGYEPVPVCAYCVEMLSITSSGKNKLRSFPISKLRAYMKAYNIRAPGAAVEKDDLVEAILKSKNHNGCLYSIHEDYYRRNSVPQGTGTADRSRARDFFFSRSTRDTPPQPSYTPRQNHQTRQAYSAPPPTGSQYSFGSTSESTSYGSTFNSTSYDSTSNSTSYGSASNSTTNERPFYSTSNRNQHPYFNTPASSNAPQFNNNNNSYNTDRNRNASMPQSNLHVPPQSPPQASQQRRPPAPSPASPPPPPPPVQVPTLNELLQKQDGEIARLPISTLKAILYDNRVNISVGVLEKEDLVRKVIALIADEKRDRELRQQEELEEARRAQQVYDDVQEGPNTSTTGLDEEEPSHRESESERSSIPDNGNVNKHNHTHRTDIPSSHEGLCVVCQDEHANMAIIDCGHLSLCKSCSELVMKTTRECPLCRTRIVTEQRLLRIFRS